MSRLHRVIGVCDAINERVGRFIAWFTAAMVAVTLAVVIMRYGFEFGRIWMQEIVMYLHAAVFMLGAAYTLQHRGHVRVDIFYQNFSERRKALVDFCGTLLLLMPVALFILVWSAGFVAKSWIRLEESPETGGLPLVFVLKTFIPLMAVLLIVQGIAELARNGLVLTGRDPGPRPHDDSDDPEV